LILGLVFLRYLCAAFEEFQAKIAASPGKQEAAASGQAAEGETGDEAEAGREAGVFVVPESARWDRLFPPPGGETGAVDAAALCRGIAEAARALERENPGLRELFPRALTRPPGRPPGRPPAPEDGGLSFPADLGRLLGAFSAGETARLFKDLPELLEKSREPVFPKGRAGSTARRGRPRAGGPARVPLSRSLSELVACMLEPYQGRFYDPCCGSAEFLAGAADFVTSRQGKPGDLAFYAQERDTEAWRLARMNLIVRGIDATEIMWNPESPLQRDLYRNLKFDFVAACPAFEENPYHWIPYILDRLSPAGLGALTLPKGALSSFREEERETRRALVEGRLVDCVVNLPPRMSGSLGSSVWIFSKAKTSRGRRGDELLFIDARRLGRAAGRRHWEFSTEDMNRVARTYHNWRFPKAAPYRDTRLFAVSVHMAQVREAGYNLNPALYLEIPETEEDAGRGAHFAALRAEFEELAREELRLNRQLLESLRKIKLED
jgi:type I restriction enzyme M protein